MRIPLYQVDAFADHLFAGNPAAICPLEAWLPDATMQQIAAENNLSETAFLVPGDDEDYRIRWFTPAKEVDLCGHATLASAWIVFEQLRPGSDTVSFGSRSGPLRVTRDGALLTLDFPARPATPSGPDPALSEALGREPEEVLRTVDIMAVFASESEVRSLRPDLRGLAALDARGIIVTSPGEACDFVSRFFAPASGTDEDPVTGSAHCTLTPYWSARLDKTELRAQQLSRRGGSLLCRLVGDRVYMSGPAVTYLQGAIEV